MQLGRRGVSYNLQLCNLPLFSFIEPEHSGSHDFSRTLDEEYSEIPLVIMWVVCSNIVNIHDPYMADLNVNFYIETYNYTFLDNPVLQVQKEQKKAFLSAGSS